MQAKMAKVMLFAESGSDWTENELHAFNIWVASVGTAQFTAQWT